MPLKCLGFLHSNWGTAVFIQMKRNAKRPSVKQKNKGRFATTKRPLLFHSITGLLGGE